MNSTLPEISSAVVRRSDLTTTQMDQMFQLLAANFDGVSQEQFERDLAEKNQVIFVTREECLVGFSTLLAYETRFEGEPVSVVYSGDTIVAPDAWGTTALPRAWIAAVNELRLSLPHGRYYWLLLTSGFRTYRFLQVFWREFFPRFDCPTPQETQRLIDHLARERFGQQYESSLVRFPQPQRLRDELMRIPQGRLVDPHIAFFVQRNPGHVNGDELVCLTELAPQNLTAAGRRMTAPRPHASPCHNC